MKKTKKTRRHTKEFLLKPTRQYTCSRKRNKEGQKVWVVLEEGRKFYRIFRKRSLAISYFARLKTIYAEMLVQDLKENFFSGIVYTKLEIVKRGAVKAFEDFDGGIVEESDELFDEDLFMNGPKTNEETTESTSKKNKKTSKDKSDDDEEEVEEHEEYNKYSTTDFSFVDDLFPKPKPLISPINIRIDTSKSNHSSIKRKLIHKNFGIKIYQSDLDINFFILGKVDEKETEKE